MINTEISFRKLHIFICFMIERNLSRTAEKLNLSSVSVHRALHSLEEALGFPLFANEGRNLVPLESAIEFVEYARKTINIFQEGVDYARDKAGIDQKILRIGILCSLVPEVLPNLIQRMKKRKPDLSIEVITGANSELIEAVNNHQLNAAIIGSPYLNASKLHFIPLFQDNLLVAMPISSPFSQRESIDLTELKEEKFISLTDNFSISLHCQEVFRLAHFSPKTVAVVHDIFSMLHLVSTEIGFTLMPGRMKKICKDNNVALIPLKDKYNIEQDISLIYTPNSEKNPNILALASESRLYQSHFLAS